jgi:hypothetical protein
VQVKGASIIDYINRTERSALIDFAAPAICAMMSDASEYPSAGRYLLSPPIADVLRTASVPLREKYHRTWVDAFFCTQYAGAHHLMAVHQSTLNLFATEDPPMSIEFAYGAKPSDTHPTPTATK